ncbi:hypothetical protein OH77DRAFT_1513132 [Trametes cingulata]|nr:hypothetical protein OH77DRAFT_1513132 [Trametes cingulata]
MPYDTRRKNASTHPGAIDLPTPRRTSAEVAADNEKKQKAAAASKKKKQNGAKRASELEVKMRRQDKQEEDTRVTQVPTAEPAGSRDVVPRQKRKLDVTTDEELGPGSDAHSKATTFSDVEDFTMSDLTVLADTPMPSQRKRARMAQNDDAEDDSEDRAASGIGGTERDASVTGPRDRDESHGAVTLSANALPSDLDAMDIDPAAEPVGEDLIHNWSTSRSLTAMTPVSKSSSATVRTKAVVPPTPADPSMSVDPPATVSSTAPIKAKAKGSKGKFAGKGKEEASEAGQVSDLTQGKSVEKRTRSKTKLNGQPESAFVNEQPAEKSDAAPMEESGAMGSKSTAAKGKSTTKDKPRAKEHAAAKSASQGDSAASNMASQPTTTEGEFDVTKDGPAALAHAADAAKTAAKRKTSAKETAALKAESVISQDDSGPAKTAAKRKPSVKQKPTSKAESVISQDDSGPAKTAAKRKTSTKETAASKAESVISQDDSGPAKTAAKRKMSTAKQKPTSKAESVVSQDDSGPAKTAAKRKTSAKETATSRAESVISQDDSGPAKTTAKRKTSAKETAASKAESVISQDDSGPAKTAAKRKPSAKQKPASKAESVISQDDSGPTKTAAKRKMSAKETAASKATPQSDFTAAKTASKAEPAMSKDEPRPTTSATAAKGKASVKAKAAGKDKAAAKGESAAMGKAATKTGPVPSHEPKKAKQRSQTKNLPVQSGDEEVNMVVDRGIFASDEEDAERSAALSSPVKGTTARMTNKNMVDIGEMDVSTPNPVRVKIEPSAGDETLTEAKASGRGAKSKSSNSSGRKGKDAQLASRSPLDDSDIEMLDGPPASKPNSTASRSTSGSSTNKKKWTTADLPFGAQQDDRWTSRFVPTLLRYQGCRYNPWSWLAESSVSVVQKIWDEVYGDSLPHDVQANDNVHKVATQRIYDWRSAIGSSAIAILESCFNASKRTRYEPMGRHGMEDIQKARKEFCDMIYQGYGFVWKDPTGRTPRQGLFHSPFILPLLATHLDQTAHAIDVPGLYNPDHPDRPTSPDRPVGAIGLISAAVERAVTLWMDGKILIQANGKPFIPKQLNPATGKYSGQTTDFSAAKFLDKTSSYRKSACSLKPHQMSRLLAAAAEHTTASSAIPETSTKQKIGRDELVEPDSDGAVDTDLNAGPGSSVDSAHKRGSENPDPWKGMISDNEGDSEDQDSGSEDDNNSKGDEDGDNSDEDHDEDEDCGKGGDEHGNDDGDEHGNDDDHKDGDGDGNEDGDEGGEEGGDEASEDSDESGDGDGDGDGNGDSGDGSGEDGEDEDGESKNDDTDESENENGIGDGETGEEEGEASEDGGEDGEGAEVDGDEDDSKSTTNAEAAGEGHEHDGDE